MVLHLELVLCIGVLSGGPQFPRGIFHRYIALRARVVLQECLHEAEFVFKKIAFICFKRYYHSIVVAVVLPTISIVQTCGTDGGSGRVTIHQLRTNDCRELAENPPTDRQSRIYLKRGGRLQINVKHTALLSTIF